MLQTESVLDTADARPEVEFRIAAPVRDRFPNLFANVIVVRGWNNAAGDDCAEEIRSLLRSNQDRLRRRFDAAAELKQSPFVSAYFDFFRSFGANPKRTKPSHYALADRVLRGGDLPDINPAVNLYNAFSIGYLVPFGGEDLDRVDTYFELTIADGSEAWTPIGAEAPSAPRAGDVVWRDRVEVSTTSLNHRQCEKTKLTPVTRNAYFISEGFRGINDGHIDAMSVEFEEIFSRLLGGRYSRFVIDVDTPATRA